MLSLLESLQLIVKPFDAVAPQKKVASLFLFCFGGEEFQTSFGKLELGKFVFRGEF
jgi:hypothetical protein